MPSVPSIVGSSSDEEVSAIGTSIVIDCGFILRDRLVFGVGERLLGECWSPEVKVQK